MTTVAPPRWLAAKRPRPCGPQARPRSRAFVGTDCNGNWSAAKRSDDHTL